MKEQIIKTLQQSYDRQTRKALVRSIIESEMRQEEPNYQIINQIFNYVIQTIGWTLSASSNSWDNTPLLIMKETFPKLENSKWYKSKELNLSSK